MGSLQRMSYQMTNSMSMESMEDIFQDTKEYIERLKESDEEFLNFLELKKNFSNDYEVLIALCNHNPEFVRSEYFRERKREIIKMHWKNVKCGKLMQNGDNLTIVGSPYAMLLHAVGENVDLDDTFEYEEGVIQCFTERFEDGEYLAGFRSPFNSLNNLSYMHNVYNENLFKYFDFGKNVIAVNLNGTDFQDRNNGSDQDSDFMLVTNQPSIVSHAKHCYKEYPTIVNNIPKEKNKYDNTLANYALIDNNLASARLAIGESSNLAQLSLTYSYNFPDKKYKDYVCILSVLAQVAIDNAKRKFDVDLNSEISRIKNDMNIKKNGYPMFWKSIKPSFSMERINKNLICPMNEIKKMEPKSSYSSRDTLPMSYFFKLSKIDGNRRKSIKVENLIEKYSFDLYDYSVNSNGDYNILEESFDELVEDIRNTYISKGYAGLMSWLINRAFLITGDAKAKSDVMSSDTSKNRAALLKVLYKVSPKVFLDCFSKNMVDKSKKK